MRNLFDLIQEKRLEWNGAGDDAGSHEEGEEESDFEDDPDSGDHEGSGETCENGDGGDDDESGDKDEPPPRKSPPSASFGMQKKREELAEIHAQIFRLKNFMQLGLQVVTK